MFVLDIEHRDTEFFVFVSVFVFVLIAVAISPLPIREEKFITLYHYVFLPFRGG